MGSTTPSPQHHTTISAIARKRRAASLATHFTPPTDPETSLPLNLATHSLESSYYTALDTEIITSPTPHILSQLASGIWTCLTVTTAFCKSSAYAQQLTNCLTEILYPEAFTRAKYLDDYLQQHGKPIGPLHGLPISLKDCFITAPHPSSIGMAAYANVPTEKDTLLVEMLREAGAVFYVKTNVPVAMMMAETNNNVWGEARNPLHKELSCGGSSGGEAALIACYGSPLGVGTDIGGSIRIPSGFCALYGLKPSFGRFPTWGGKTGIPGQEFILAVNGPMSRDLDSLSIYAEALVGGRPWERDHKVLPIPWRKQVIQPKGRKLRFGMVGEHDGLVHCHPPVKRALKMAREAVERQGHEVVDWEPRNHDVMTKNLAAAFFDLGGGAIMELLEPHEEPIFPSMKGYEMAAKAGPGALDAVKLRNMIIKRNQLQKDYVDYWNASATDGKEPIDGIIMALYPICTPRLGATQPDLYVGYTGVWNFLDFPGCTFPVTTADKSLDKPRDMKAFKQLSEIDGRIQADYDPDFYHGAPVSLQCIGRRLEEEKVLEMVDVIAKALKA